jgi:replicative DNA helicase
MEQPHSEESEKILISCCLLLGDSDTYDTISQIVKEDDFYNEDYKILYRCISNIFKRGSTIDEILLLEEMRKQDSQLSPHDIFHIKDATATTLPALSSAKVIADRARSRHLLKSARQAIENIVEGKDSEEVAVQLETDIHQATEKLSTAQNISEPASNLRGKFEAMLNGTYKVQSLSTGIPHLDEKLDEGGIGKGEVMVISAPTSCGKSQLALNIILRNSVSNNKPVGIFSFEMPSEQLTKRMIQTSSAVNLKRIREQVASEEQVKRVFEATDKLAEAPIYTEHFVRGVDDLRSKARAMKRKHKIEALVIDYLQLIPYDPRMKKNDGVAYVSHCIKQLAIELNIPILLLAQVNREGAKRETGLSLYDLKDSGDIENDADIILLMWASNGGDVEQSKMVDTNGVSYINLKYKIAKNREGERDTTGFFKFLNYTGRFQ